MLEFVKRSRVVAFVVLMALTLPQVIHYFAGAVVNGWTRFDAIVVFLVGVIYFMLTAAKKLLEKSERK